MQTGAKLILKGRNFTPNALVKFTKNIPEGGITTGFNVRADAAGNLSVNDNVDSADTYRINNIVTIQAIDETGRSAAIGFLTSFGQPYSGPL